MDLGVEWLGRTPYRVAWERQRRLAAERAAGQTHDTLLLVEHEPVLTLGRHASEAHVLATPEELARRGIEVIRVERGGEATYHGPGQLVAYPIVHLQEAGLLLRPFVRALEAAMADTAATFGVTAGARGGYPGIWVVPDSDTPRKLGAVGLRVARGVTFHGIALNVTARLADFSLIDPCGMAGLDVTSIAREADWPAARAAPSTEGVRVANASLDHSGDGWMRPSPYPPSARGRPETRWPAASSSCGGTTSPGGGWQWWSTASSSAPVSPSLRGPCGRPTSDARTAPRRPGTEPGSACSSRTRSRWPAASPTAMRESRGQPGARIRPAWGSSATWAHGRPSRLRTGITPHWARRPSPWSSRCSPSPVTASSGRARRAAPSTSSSCRTGAFRPAPGRTTCVSTSTTCPRTRHRIGEELGGAARYVIREGICPWCRLVRNEVAGRERLVYEDAASVVFAPYASRSPFELWVVPRHHEADFGRSTDEQLTSAAETLQKVIRLLGVLDGPAYNLVLHTAPLHERVDETYHWHWEIHPRLREIAGLEMGTGLPVNPVSPEEATDELLAATRAATGAGSMPDEPDAGRSWDAFPRR